jgi:dTDP-4-amino-4,6-dideoxygalactose transaminase
MLFARRLRNSQFAETGLSGHDGEKRLFERAPGCQYRFPENLEAPLASALDGFPEVVEKRRRQVEIWNRFLAPFDDAIRAPQADCVVPWRLIRRVPGVRDRIVAALRNDGIDAGTNFPPLSASFPVLLAGQRYDGAEQWGREVLNLWVTPDYDAGRMRRAADVIGVILSEHREA